MHQLELILSLFRYTPLIGTNQNTSLRYHSCLHLLKYHFSVMKYYPTRSLSSIHKMSTPYQVRRTPARRMVTPETTNVRTRLSPRSPRSHPGRRHGCYGDQKGCAECPQANSHAGQSLSLPSGRTTACSASQICPEGQRADSSSRLQTKSW